MRLKKSFETPCSVNDKVNAIKKADDNVKCVLRVGRCATHNNKLIRNVRKKRYSCINPVTGGLMGKFRNVTSLECPGRAKRTGIALGSSDVSPTIAGGNSNNKKFKLDESEVCRRPIRGQFFNSD